MAQIIKNKKGFLIIQCSAVETLKFGGMGVCDFCNNTDRNGYYIAVLNSWYCKSCYERWNQNAVRYVDDNDIEVRNFNYYRELLGV